MAKTKQPEIEHVKSITNKVLNGGKPVTKAQIGKSIGEIEGTVRKYSIKDNKYGESIRFDGEFVGKKADGGFIESDSVYLPRSETDSLLKRLKDSDTEIKIAYTIAIVASDKNDRGFAYVADEPITEERKTAKAELREKFLAQHA